MEDKKGFSRRDFLRLSGVAATGAFVAACAPAAPQTVEKTVVVEKTVEVEKEVEVEITSTPAPAEEIVLRFLYDATPDEVAWHEKTEADFEALHPNIDIQPEPTLENWREKALAAMVAGTAPDLLIAWTSNFVAFASRGAYMDITDFVKGWSDFDDFWPGGIKECTIDGKIYAVPYCYDPVTLYFYNGILLEEEGISPPDDTWTYDDFRENVLALTKKDDDGNVVQWGFGGAEAVYTWGWKRAYPVIYAYGGRVYNDDMTHCTIAEPEALEGINLIWDLKVKHGAAPTPAMVGDMAEGQMFASGLIAYETDGPWKIGSMREMVSDPELEQRWDVGHSPWGPAGRFVWAVGNNWGIWNGTKHPDEAMELLQFLTDADRAKEVGTIAHRVPARESAADSFGDFGPPDNQGLIPQTLAYAISPPVHPTKGAEINDVLTAAWEKFMILEQGTPEEALSEAVAKVDALLAEG